MVTKLKQKLLLLATVGFIIAINTACKDDVASSNIALSKKGDELQESNSLVGTKWKLTAFVDVENNIRIEPDYYTITDENEKGNMLY